MLYTAKGGWIIVLRRPLPTDIRSRGGIILPPNDIDEEFFTASIVSVGEVFEEESKLQVGDYVIVRNHSAKLKLGSSKPGVYYAVDYDDIVALVNEDEESD